jgi:ribonuclease HII
VRFGPPDGSRDLALQELYGLLAGVDEVGRGALAGPVTVAAVILDPKRPVDGLDDSKRLSPRRRIRLAGEVMARAVAWTVVHRSQGEIDEMNILEATRSAMHEAVLGLAPPPGAVVSDAVRLRSLPFPVFAEVRADGEFQCVAAASIIAKVTRDSLMVAAARETPGYGWERNKGYGSPEHLEALRRMGPTALHRLTFKPVRVLG